MATHARTLNGTMFFTIMLIVMSASMMISQCQAQLSPTFYDKTCPKALDTIRASITSAVSTETRMAASLLRLHFHDCIVQGCDASILLTDGGERRTTLLKNRSVRGFEVIDKAKRKVEKICPGVVSCADIVAVAARDATVAVGGPSWEVKLGRRDSTASADEAQANLDLPASNSSLDGLISLFEKKGLSTRDMVALSGAHTIGLARCISYRERIYSNGTDIDAGFASTLQRGCPLSGRGLGTAPLDLVTPSKFDNSYFKILMQKKGLLPTDQALFNGGSTDSIVSEYAANPARFMSDFVAGMIKMGDIKPLTGSQGQIRKICSVPN